MQKVWETTLALQKGRWKTNIGIYGWELGRERVIDMPYKDMKKKMEYFQKNKEKINKKNRDKYWSNPEKYKETRKKYWKKYYKKNKKIHLKNSKEWHIKNRETVREQGKIRYKQSPKKYRLKSKKWKERNRKKYLLIHKKHNRIRIKNLEYYKRKFLTLQKISGKRIPKCIICGEEDIRLLTKNHRGTPINQLKKDRKTNLDSKILSGNRKLKDLEVRCYNCNFLYEYERGNRKLDKKEFERILKEEKIIYMSDKIK